MSNSAKSFIYLCFSENGQPSSKRVLGCLMILVILGLLIAFTAGEGCTDNVKDIIELVIITAGALLGISSVTSIWKGGSGTKVENKSEEENEEY